MLLKVNKTNIYPENPDHHLQTFVKKALGLLQLIGKLDGTVSTGDILKKDLYLQKAVYDLQMCRDPVISIYTSSFLTNLKDERITISSLSSMVRSNCILSTAFNILIDL